MLATFTDTATPTPVPPLLVEAEPSAIACPSTFAAEVTLSMPPAVTCTLSWIDAVDDAFSIATATAPATLTPPLEVEALSFDAPSEPFAPLSFSFALSLPNLVCLLVALSTDWLLLLLSS